MFSLKQIKAGAAQTQGQDGDDFQTLKFVERPTFCYIIITPDPRNWHGWAVGNAPGAMLPTTASNGTVGNFNPPKKECYFIKIGDQAMGCTRDDSYETLNPSFYWCNVEVGDFKREDHGGSRLGTVLEGEIFKNFRRYGHGREWYYSFGQGDNLRKLIGALERSQVGGAVRFESLDHFHKDLDEYFVTE